MKIHFICLGNTFRSRLADAYLKSLSLSGVEVSSSGVIAQTANNDLICWYTREILVKENLLSFGKESWTQTDTTSAVGQDMIIFMHPSVHEIFGKNWSVPVMRFEIWDIEDGDPGWDSMERRGASDAEKVLALQGASERYQLIVRRVDELVKRLHL